MSQNVAMSALRWYALRSPQESYVTFNTGNCILETIFVVTTNQSRATYAIVWMTGTRSA
jgi:hypothetical protein